MSMLYSKIKFEIDIINHKILKTIREQKREIKMGESGRGNLLELKPCPKITFMIIQFKFKG
jgi:hypothetical protein